METRQGGCSLSALSLLRNPSIMLETLRKAYGPSSFSCYWLSDKGSTSAGVGIV